MFGSMFIGLSGMQAYSAGLRQISNNISNMNSVGFKGSEVHFTDVFGNLGSGRQGVGYGVTLNDSRLDLGQGELRQSDRDLDLAIDGDGFLVLLREADQYFARTGSFEVDRDGYVVLSGTDYRLSVLDESGNPTAVSINSVRSSEPAATTRVTFSDNLSIGADSFDLPDLTVYTPSGEAETWSVRFERDSAAANIEWEVIVTNSAGTEIGREVLRFIGGIIDTTTQELTFEDATTGLSVVFDFSTDVTSFSSGSVSSLRASDVDGYPLGDLISLTINDQGELEVGYSNEQTASLGSIAIATLRDPDALQQDGAGLFTATRANQMDIGSAQDTTNGSVLSRTLEASNVDLSEAFGDLILIQRGYQASSQVVSVSNDMIQQLFGLRGQG